MDTKAEEFQKLRSLLSLKRHEVPPPGYFNHFADRVIAGIEEMEVLSKDSLWEWLRSRLDIRPLLACGFSVALCGAIFSGLVISQDASFLVQHGFSPHDSDAGGSAGIRVVHDRSMASSEFHTGSWGPSGVSSLAPVISSSAFLSRFGPRGQRAIFFP